MVFIQVFVYLSGATSTSVWQNCRLVLRLTFYLNFKVCTTNEVLVRQLRQAWNR